MQKVLNVTVLGADCVDAEFPKLGITMTDLYLRITCAIACYALERKDEAKGWLFRPCGLLCHTASSRPLPNISPALAGWWSSAMNRNSPVLTRRSWNNGSVHGKTGLPFITNLPRTTLHSSCPCGSTILSCLWHAVSLTLKLQSSMVFR